MEFDKIVLCVIGGILIFVFIAVCIIKHKCLPQNSSQSSLLLQNRRSIINVGAHGVITTLPKNSSRDNIEDYIGDDIL